MSKEWPSETLTMYETSHQNNAKTRKTQAEKIGLVFNNSHQLDFCTSTRTTRVLDKQQHMQATCPQMCPPFSKHQSFVTNSQLEGWLANITGP
jgi:hypothetical protein